jgi:hypothetical protein
MKIDLSTII